MQLFRYTLRLDGFVSRSAPYAGGEVVTQPLCFAGDALHINFATSAAGSLRVVIEDEAGSALPGFDSGELFGDAADRAVHFDGNLAALARQLVRLRFILRDADLYAFQFCTEGK